uniref:Uncharacterized protein n=1 Tax=Musca domestica TaxID=7370 RepID=A0A1I8NKI3_MUSDO
MYKTKILHYLLLLLTLWAVDACRFNCPKNVPVEEQFCATDKVGKTCWLLSKCRLNAENCNRRMLRQPDRDKINESPSNFPKSISQSREIETQQNKAANSNAIEMHFSQNHSEDFLKSFAMATNL